MICLLGYSASGKDTILHELMKMGYIPLISYTTRKPRHYEQNHVDYHFITNADFIDKLDSNFFAEKTSYNTIDGKAYYGSAFDDISDDKVCIVNPDGLSQLQCHDGLNIASFYIDVPKRILIKRLKKRGDKRKEYRRRLKRDRIDFKRIENKVDFVIDGMFNSPHVLALEIIEKARLKNL